MEKTKTNDFFSEILVPCRVARRGLNLGQQLNIITEEVGEVSKALRNNEKRYRVGEELGDVIFACITALDMLGFDAAGRADVLHRVYEKNLKRGYIEE